MGRLFAKSLSGDGLVEKSQVLVCDRKKKALKGFEKLGYKTSSDVLEVIEWSEVIIISTKPQDFKKLEKKLKGRVRKKILISIMAGVSFKTLSRTKAKKIIRAMPNQPAKVGAGMTVWAVNEKDKDLIALGKSIFSPLGKEILLKKRGKDADKLLNAATAVSGSGPAYFYYVAEQMEKELRQYWVNHRKALKRSVSP